MGTTLFTHTTVSLQSDYKPHQRNITLKFLYNSAANTQGMYNGKSIFATSLQSCITPGKKKSNNLTRVLNEIANFTFLQSKAYNQVITSGAKLDIDKQSRITIIPGKEVHLKVTTKDEFNHIVASDYRVFIHHQKVCPNYTMDVDYRYKSLPNGRVKLYGKPGHSCNITIETEGHRLMYISQLVTLAKCPPGFVLKNVTSP